MAEEFGDGAFWLPSEFLCDDFLVEEARKRRAEAAIVLRQRLGSKVEPHDAAAAADTASIEEYMATIARQMAQASIVVTENAKTRQTAGTPHSVLCPYLASTRRNANDPSLVSSMPSLPLERQQNDAWDLLCEAAAQVTWLRHNDAVFLRKNASLEIPRIPNYTRVGYYSSPALPQHQQLQSAQFRYLKQQQWSSASEGHGKARGSRPHGLFSSAWQASPTLHQPIRPCHGMGSVLPNGSAAKRLSAGTGVFLPRIPVSKAEPRKTTDCSTVIVPAKVVRALKELGAQPRFEDDFLHSHNARGGRSNVLFSHQNLNHQVFPSTSMVAREIRLPQEWSY
ncbi:hypothetical protein OPV22_013974 [Ensete ventricosum]|uniref:Uncharacterized protein n=1 Tax=Ensete ventricosum TaxID=4639 RepID=A0AAV8R8S0_ENSVE|nr:hypothetical protein OPV22_013974 [Ensete ventricosum]